MRICARCKKPTATEFACCSPCRAHNGAWRRQALGPRLKPETGVNYIG